MTATADNFHQLFQQLRCPFGININEVSVILESLYSNPESIHPLICFLQSANDPIYKQHALIGITQCLNRNKSKISPEIANYIKNVSLVILQHEEVQTVKRALVILLIHLIEDYQINVIDVHQAIINLTIPLDAAFLILSHLIYKIERKEVLNDLNFFYGLLNSGFSSDNFDTVANALTLLLSLIGNLRSLSNFTQYQDVVLNLLLKIAHLGDSQKFSALAKSLIRAYENGFSLVPFFPLLTNFLPIIRDDEVDIEYRLQLHTFLASAFIFNRDFVLPEDYVVQLFDTEIYLSFQIFQLDYADPTMNWLFDIDLMLHELYYRLLDKALLLIEARITQLLNINTDTSIAVSLVLLDNALDCAEEQCIHIREKSFLFLLECLTKMRSECQRISIPILINHAQFYSEEIDKNIFQVIEAAHAYMKQIDANNGARLLLSIIEQATPTDLVFEPLLKFFHDMLSCQDSQVQYYGIQMLAILIERSSSISPELYNYLLTESIDKLSFESPYSSIFTILSSLCAYDSARFAPALSIIIPKILSEINLDDPYPVSDTVSFINTAITRLPTVMSKYSKDIFQLLKAIADKMWPPETYSGSGSALESLASLLLSETSQDGAEIVISTMIKFSENNLCVPAFKTLEIMANLIPPQYCETMINICLNKIESTDDTATIVSALEALRSLPSLLGNEERFIKAMFKLVNTVINPITKALQRDEQIELTVAEILPEVVFDSDLYIDETFQLLIKKMHEGGSSTNFALHAFYEIFYSVPEAVSEPIQNDILKFLIDLIPNGHPKLVESGSLLICVSCDLHVFTQNALQIVKLIIDRISKEQSSSMTDSLVAAIITLITQVPEINFPFDSILPIILKVLPPVHNTEFLDEIYPFFASLVKNADTQTIHEILRVFINLLARPYQNIVALRMTDKSKLAIISTLKNLLPENKDEFIATCLNYDQNRINDFITSYNRTSLEVA